MIDFHSQLAIIPQVYNSAELQDNLEHSGGITISWNAATDDEIPLGAYITYGGLRYVLLDPYAPSKESAIPHYQYQPQFKHPQNMLDRIPFWIKSLDAEGKSINLETTSYTGYPYIIAQKLCDFINSEYVTETGDSFFAATIGNTWSYEIPATLNQEGLIQSSHIIITVPFDGCSIKSAANAIADAMGCNVYWDWKAKVIRFKVGSTIQGETYNCFHVLGGTTNMGKNTISGGFAAVTQRLTLDEANYPGSMLPQPLPSGIRLTTNLVFNDIYPKQELYIRTARQRLCYLTNEDGEFIIDHMDGDTPVYKTFSKWYVTFKNANGTPYTFDQSLLINDKALGLLFQIDYDHPEVMSSLVGQQFELTYYANQQTEHDRNDVSDSFTVEAGEFFIAVKAEGNILLPASTDIIAKGTVDYAYSAVNALPQPKVSELGKTAIVKHEAKIYSCQQPAENVYDWIPVQATISNGDGYIVRRGNLDGSFMSTNVLANHVIIWNNTNGQWSDGGQYGGLVPRLGDKVTLVNMALSETQINNAKSDLLNAANEIITAMTTPSGEYQETVILGKSHYNGDSTKQIITSVSVGEETIFERDVEAQDRKHGPVVTQIQQNIDTGIVQVTVGSWTRKTKTGGTVDKLETVSVSSSSPTNGGDSLGDGSFGPGGGYSGGGSSSTEQNTINQTVLKPDSLFLATLGNTIDAVSCDSEGKVRIESDIYSYITGKYGTKDVTASCTVSVHTLPTDQSQTAGVPLKPRIYIESSSTGTSGTEITQVDTAYELTDAIRWIRIHMPVGYDLSLLEDNYTQLFSIEHPAFTDRGLSMTIQAMREGAEGIGGAFKSRVFRRTNTDISNTRPTGGTYASPYPTDEDSDHRLLWSDGIPQGEEKLWSSVATFEPNTTNPTWSLPSQETDTMTLDIEFAAQQSGDAKPAEPTANNRHKDEYPYGYEGQIWFDPDLDKYSAAGVLRDFTNMYWRAEREKKNGAWGDWSITLIKGEKGEDAISPIYAYCDYVFGKDYQGNNRPENPSITELGQIDLLRYDSSLVDMIDVCEDEGDGTYGWEAYEVPIGRRYMLRGTNLVYRATENGWVLEGETVVVASLDNQHEDFVYNDAGERKSDIVTSQARLYEGSIERTTNCTWSIDSNGTSGVITDSSSADFATKGTSISNTGLLTVKHITADTAKVRVRAEYPTGSGKYYYSEFTANKTNQDKYELVLSPNSIPFNPASYTTQSVSISAKRTSIDGSTTNLTFGSYDDMSKISTDSTKGYLRLFAVMNIKVGQAWVFMQVRVTSASKSFSKDEAANNTNIIFNLYKYDDPETVDPTGTPAGMLVDTQSIPVTKAQNGNDGDDALYYIDEYGRASSRDLVNGYPDGFDTTTGWNITAPAKSETYPYIWKRSRLWDPNEEDWAEDSEWVYICLTGEDGGQGPQGNAYTLKTSPSQLIYNPTTTNWVGSSGFRVSRLNNGQTSSEGTLTVYHVDSNGTRGNAITPVNEVYSPSSSDSRCDVVWTINNAVVAEVSVAIVKFGEQGGTGHVGRWYYFAGEYSETPGDYEMEETQAPYVYTVSNNTKLFWMLDFKGENPASGVATEAPSDSSTQWTRMQSEHEYYIARAYFGDSAYLGSFIIDGDWMISQAAATGSPSNDFTHFNPYFPDSQESGTHAKFSGNNFIPMYAVDGVTGATYQNDAHVRGEIEAESGHIGGFKIGSNTIADDNNTPTFTLDSTNKKLVVGDVEIRSDLPSLNHYWSGMASKSGFGDSVAIGMRKYTNGSEVSYGGHLSLQGNGSTGGILDINTGGDISNCLFKMGLDRDANTHEIKERISMQVGVYNDYLESNQASIELKSLADTTKSTKITPSSITTPEVKATSIITPEVKTTSASIPVALPHNVVLCTSTSYTLPSNPTKGEFVFFKSLVNVTIYTGSVTAQIYESQGSTLSPSISIGGEAAIFVFDGTNWISFLSH